MARLPAFDDATLEQICKLLGDALTGSEIGRMLEAIKVEDPGANMTKWKRLLAALDAQQRRHGVGNHVVQFVHAAMAPVRYVGQPHVFDDQRAALNPILAFAGYTLGPDGKMRHAEAVATVAEAEERAGRLRAELTRRRVHADVLKACRAELLQDNYFHAVLEAAKSVALKIRQRTGLTTDGHRLVDDAFGLAAGHPRLAFNSLRTESERNEHVGLMNVMKGVFSAFRNPTAHEPKVTWIVEEQDALDLLSTVSILHRRLDGAVVVPHAPPPP